MPSSPFRDRLMRGYACTRLLDRQADSLRARMADLACDPSAAPDVLASIRALRETLDRAEATCRLLAAEQNVAPAEGGPTAADLHRLSGARR